MEASLSPIILPSTCSYDKIWVLNDRKDWVLCQRMVNDKKKMCYIIYSIEDDYQIIIPYAEEKSRIKKYRKHEGKNISDILAVDGMMEEEVIEIILDRFIKNNNFYTYCGKTLLALDTWKDVEIFDDKLKNYYLSKRKGPPHIYDLLMNLLDQIKLFKISRKVIFKGFNNSGRSRNFFESMKFVIARQKLPEDNQNLKKKISSAYQILRSFTSSRDNGGRINFRTSTWFMTLYKNDVLTHFRLLPFLFNASHLNSNNHQETNFQIFYQICCKFSKELFPNIKIASENEYILLSNARLSFNKNEEICEDFKKTIEAFKILDFSDEEIEAIARIVVAILLINNCDITNINTEPSEYISKDLSIAHASLILGLDLELAKIIISDGNTFASTTELNGSILKEKVKSLGQYLYMHLIWWMFRKINASSNISNDHIYLLLMDLEGFYNQSYNGLDNLYINACNEKIESISSTNTLKDIVQLNLNEGTDFDLIFVQPNHYSLHSAMNIIFKYHGEVENGKNEKDFKDFKTVECEKSYNVQGDTINTIRSTSVYYEKTFTIKHFCQDVSYCKDDFVERTENSTINNFMILENSKNEIIKMIVTLPPFQNQNNERTLYNCNCLFTPYEYLFYEKGCNFSNRNPSIHIFIEMMNEEIFSDYFTVLCLSSEKELTSVIDNDYIRKQLKHYNFKSSLKIYNSFTIRVPMKVLFKVYYGNFLSDTISISENGIADINLIVSKILENTQNFKKTKNYMMMSLNGFKELENIRHLALKPYRNLIKIFLLSCNFMITLSKQKKLVQSFKIKDNIDEITLMQSYIKTYQYLKRYKQESIVILKDQPINSSNVVQYNPIIQEQKSKYNKSSALIRPKEKINKQMIKREFSTKIFEDKRVELFNIKSQVMEISTMYKESFSYLKDICNFLIKTQIELNKEINMDISSYIEKLENPNLFNIFQLLIHLNKNMPKIHRNSFKKKSLNEVENEKINSSQYNEFLSIYTDLEIISISSKLPILFSKIDDKIEKAKMPIEDEKMNIESERICNNCFISQINIMKCLEVLFSEQFLDQCFSEKKLFSTLIYLIVSTCINENNTQLLNQFYFGFECNLEKFIFVKSKSCLYLSYMLEEILRISNNLKQLIQEMNIRSKMILKYNSLLYFINKINTYTPLIVNSLLSIIKTYICNFQEDFLETSISNLLSRNEMDLMELKNPEAEIKGISRFIFKMNKLLKVFKCAQMRKETQNLLINDIFEYCNKMIFNSFITFSNLCSLSYAKKLEENIENVVEWYLKFIESEEFDIKMKAFNECKELIIVLSTSNDLLDDLKEKIKKLNHQQVFQILTNSNMNLAINFDENIKLKIEEICAHLYSQKTDFSETWNLLSSEELNQNIFEKCNTIVYEFEITEETIASITEYGINIQKKMINNKLVCF